MPCLRQLKPYNGNKSTLLYNVLVSDPHVSVKAGNASQKGAASLAVVVFVLRKSAATAYALRL